MSKTYKRNSFRKPKKHGKIFDKKKDKSNTKEKPAEFSDYIQEDIE
jgi:hypothetical protein